MKFTGKISVVMMLLALTGCGITDSVSSGVKRVGSGFKSVGKGIAGAGKKIVPGGESAAGRAGDGEREYFLVEMNGERRSKGYRVRNQSRYHGVPCTVSETVQTTELVRDGSTYKQTVTRKVITGMDGAALYLSEVRINGGERETETVTVSGSKAVFETTGAGGTQRETIDVPQGIMFGIEPVWLVRQGLKAGQSFEAMVMDRSGRRVVRERAKVLGLRVEEVMDTECEVWVVETVQQGATPVQMLFTRDGGLVRLESQDLVVRTVSREEADRQTTAVRIVSTVPVDFPLPAWDNFSTLIYRLEPAEEWRPYIRKSEYVSVRESAGGLEVSLNKIAPRLRREQLPMQVPQELHRYLEKAENIWPHKREIQTRARGIIRGEKGVLRVVALLAGWVHQKVRFQPRGSLNPNPISTMEEERGDCSEHANLFASLARSLGIPTRHCYGLLVQRERAVYHTWIEVWIADKWVPVDTTVNRVGLPSGYFLTARGTGDGIPRDEFAWAMRRGTLVMHLASAVKVHTRMEGGQKRRSRHTLVPGEKRSYVAVDGRWLANLYWGFSLIRPEPWTGRVTLNSVELRSDDQQATLKCEALPNAIRATESGLDQIVSSLERNLPGFRNKDARIIPFGKPYPANSLLVDFVCEQGGVMLRCHQYIVPKRGRSYRISVWAPEKTFDSYMPAFRQVLSSILF